MFNRNEQIILLLLCAILLVGVVISYLDNKNPDSIPNFEVKKNAVTVPSPAKKTEAPQTTQDLPQMTQGSLDINRATAKDFERLPGIGPQISARIVAYREQNGAFKSIDDITKVRGIGPKTLERLRPYLVVNTP